VLVKSLRCLATAVTVGFAAALPAALLILIIAILLLLLLLQCVAPVVIQCCFQLALYIHLQNNAKLVN
jgi:type III secretory pathway component EscR